MDEMNMNVAVDDMMVAEQLAVPTVNEAASVAVANDKSLSGKDVAVIGGIMLAGFAFGEGVKYGCKLIKKGVQKGKAKIAAAKGVAEAKKEQLAQPEENPGDTETSEPVESKKKKTK